MNSSDDFLKTVYTICRCCNGYWNNINIIMFGEYGSVFHIMETSCVLCWVCMWL